MELSPPSLLLACVVGRAFSTVLPVVCSIVLDDTPVDTEVVSPLMMVTSVVVAATSVETRAFVVRGALEAAEEALEGACVVGAADERSP